MFEHSENNPAKPEQGPLANLVVINNTEAHLDEGIPKVVVDEDILAKSASELTGRGYRVFFVVQESNQSLANTPNLDEVILEKIQIILRETNPAGTFTTDSGQLFVDNGVICMLNYYPPDGLDTICYVDDKLSQIMSPDDIRTMQATIAKNIFDGNNPTSGLESGLAYLKTRLDSGETHQVVPTLQPTATAFAPRPQEQTEPVIVQPSSESNHNNTKFVEVLGGFTGFAALITLAFIGKRTLIEPRRQAVDRVKSRISGLTDRGERISEISDLNAYLQLADELNKSYPNESHQLFQQSEDFARKLGALSTQIADAIEEQQELKWFSNPSRVSDLSSLIARLNIAADELIDAHKKAEDRLDDVRERLVNADEIIDKARKRFDRVTEFLTQNMGKHPELLDFSEFLRGMSEDFNIVETAQKNGQQLLGADLATEFSKKYDKFIEPAVESTVSLSESLSPFTQAESDQVWSSAQYHLQQALEDMRVEKIDFIDVQLSARLGWNEYRSAEVFVRDLENTSAVLDESTKSIEDHKNDHFNISDHVSGLLSDSKAFIVSAQELVNSRQIDWAVAKKSLASARESANKAHTAMDNWVELHRSNNRELQQLSIQVAELTTSGQNEVLEKWQQLASYPNENYPGLSTMYQDAMKELKMLFDDPSDPNDLASIAGGYNDMESQRFDQAEKEIKSLYSRLEVVRQQYQAITGALETVVQAEQSLDSLFEKAETKISEAKQLLEGENDRFVKEATEEMMAIAEERLRESRMLGQKRMFVPALKELHNVIDQAMSAIETIQRELSEYRRIDKNLESSIRENEDDLGDLARIVERTSSSVLEPSIYTSVTAFEENLTKIKRDKDGTKLLEAPELITELLDLNKRSGVLKREMKEINRRIDSLKAEYQQLINQVVDEINSAKTAIAAAESKLREAGSGSAGRSELAQARSEMPAIPDYGTTKFNLKLISEKARSAKQLANTSFEASKRVIHQRQEDERRQDALDRLAAAAAATSSHSRSEGSGGSHQESRQNSPPARGGVTGGGVTHSRVTRG